MPTGCSAALAFDPSLCGYDFGAGHPMSPARVDLTLRLAAELGLVSGVHGSRLGVPVITSRPAGDDLLASVHTPELIAAVRRASADPTRTEASRGLGTSDNPTFEGMHEAAAAVVGATVEAARQVWQGSVNHAANIAGGLHHAMPELASGFCVYNDVAIAIQWLLDAGARRVAYVDVDVHHGDGVQRVFYKDPRVLTISLHETGRALFPGTGFSHEIGTGDAAGSSVNVALPPGTADAGWLRAFHAVVPPLVKQFAPDILVTQHGCDSHAEDPLAHLMLSVDGQRASYSALHSLAHQVCAGKWVATGGGGYSVLNVVPRAWSHLLAVLGGAELPPGLPVPPGWRDYVAQTFGRAAPTRMTDGRTAAFREWESGFDQASGLDRAVQATREAVFGFANLRP